MLRQFLIDARSFCQEHGHMEGVLDVLELPRLQDMLFEPGSRKLSYRLDGLTGKRGQPRLRLGVSGVLPLVCQRCLSFFEEPLEINSLLELVAEDTELTQQELENDSLDFLPVAKTLDVRVLIEDEILLALPVYPYHDDCGLSSVTGLEGNPPQPVGLKSLKGKA